MKYSENYNLALPSRDDNDIADINEISNNFESLDSIISKIADTYNTVINKKILFNKTNGESGTVTFSENCDKYDYLEIFYCDDTLRRGGYTKIYPPYDALLTLQMQDPGTSTVLKQSVYTISSTSLAPNVSASGRALVNEDNSCTVNMGTNYLKITRVVGIRNAPALDLSFDSSAGKNEYTVSENMVYNNSYFVSYYNTEYSGYIIKDQKITINVVSVPWEPETYFAGTSIPFMHWSTGEEYELYIYNDNTDTAKIYCGAIKEGTTNTWLAQGSPNDRIIIYKRD